MTFPGEELLIKLWETLAEKGVGGLLNPWQTRREGLARLELRSAELVALAAAERDANDIRTGRKRLEDVSVKYLLPGPASRQGHAQSPSLPLLDAPWTVEVSTRALLSDGIRREVNIAKAVVQAEMELKDDPHEPPTRSIDEDWLFRWRENVGEISSEQLQSLWGKLLAGELKSPGSYSLRALEFLRNLSAAEAGEIARLSRFVVAGVIVRSEKAILDAEGISFGFLLRMQDLGIVSGAEATALTGTFKSLESNRFAHYFRSHGRALFATHDDPAKTITLNIVKLTDVGHQILRLGRFEPHDLYLRKVGERIKAQDVNVSLANYRYLSDTVMETFDDEVL